MTVSQTEVRQVCTCASLAEPCQHAQVQYTAHMAQGGMLQRASMPDMHPAGVARICIKLLLVAADEQDSDDEKEQPDEKQQSPSQSEQGQEQPNIMDAETQLITPRGSPTAPEQKDEQASGDDMQQQDDTQQQNDTPAQAEAGQTSQAEANKDDTEALPARGRRQIKGRRRRQ